MLLANGKECGRIVQTIELSIGVVAMVLAAEERLGLFRI